MASPTVMAATPWAMPGSSSTGPHSASLQTKDHTMTIRMTTPGRPVPTVRPIYSLSHALRLLRDFAAMRGVSPLAVSFDVVKGC